MKVTYVAPYDFNTNDGTLIRKGDKLVKVSEGSRNIHLRHIISASVVWYDKDIGQFYGCEIWGTRLSELAI
jgi:hypothetical protein